MNFIRTTTEKDFVILQDGDNIMIVHSGGQIILNNMLMPLYEEKIENKTFLVFDDKTTPIVDNITFSRVDEFIIYLFQNKLITNDEEFVLHLDGNTLNNSANNLKIATSQDLRLGGWDIDEADVEKELRLLFASENLKNKYEELKIALANNPYNLPKKFVPKKHGIKLTNKKYDGLDIYHASLSGDQRVFYVVRKDSVVVVEIELKGVVKIIQAYGHDYRG